MLSATIMKIFFVSMAVIVVSVAAALLAIAYTKHRSAEDITILDGPGTCVERFTGIISEIRTENGKKIMTVDLDRDFADYYNEKQFNVKLSGNLTDENPGLGNHVEITFSEGFDASVAPKLIKGVINFIITE